MRFMKLAGSLALICSVVLCGCGGGGGTTTNPPPPGGSTAPVSLAMTDAPPAGVSVLSFEVTVTGAVLQPGNVQLITTPVQIEVKRLEVEAAFLSTLNVPAGTYTSLAVSFSNPELTIRNDSNAGIGAVCAVGAICEFKPAVSGTFTYSSAPFPLTFTAGVASGLLVDVNLNSLITGPNTIDFSAAGALVVTQLTAAAGTGQLEELEDVKGRVSAVRSASNEFDLQLGNGRSLTIRVDSLTQFEDFNDPGGINCAANNFTCLAVGQVLEVDLRLIAGGGLLARKVEAEDNDNEEELEGIVVAVEGVTSPTFFEMVLTDEAMNAAGVEVGQRVRVNLMVNSRFRIDDDNLPVVSADFDASSDLLVGQVVEVERRSPVATGGTPPAPMFDTDRVKLKDTRLTGRIQSIDTANNRIVLDNLPTLLGVTTLEVRVTSGQTEFKDTTGLATLAVGNTISVRGPLFKGSTAPFLMAKKIRKR